MAERASEASATVERSAVLRARFAELYETLNETIRTSRDLCDIARTAQERARRTVARQR